MRSTPNLVIILVAAMLSACGSGGGSPSSSPGSAPAVLFHTPSGTDVPVNTAITAVFSKRMNTTAFTNDNVTVTSGGAPVSGSLSFDSTLNTIVFTPTPPLNYGKEYTVTIKSGVHDTSGIAMVNDYTWSFTTRTAPKPGDVDASFGNGSGALTGIVVTPVSSTGADAAPAVAIQADGKIVAAGSSYNGSDYDFAVVRYNSDGTLDTSFGTGGIVTTPIGQGNDLAYGVVIDSAGKIVVAGSSSIDANNSDFAVVRYTANGQLDTSFDGDGKVATSFSPAMDAAYAIKIQPDGKIVVAGLANAGALVELNGVTTTNSGDIALARYETDGAPDTSFGNNGQVTTSIGPNIDIALALAIDDKSRIIVAGFSNQGASSGNDSVLARYTPDGSLDNPFGNNGIVITPLSTGNDIAYAIAIQTDGMIVTAGVVNSGSHTDFALARHRADGQPDTDFGDAGKVAIPIGSANDAAFAVAIQPDGRILVAGTAFVNGRGKDFALARRLPDGSADISFGNRGTLITPIGPNDDQIYAMALDGNKIIVAGSTGEISSPPDLTKGDFALVRYWQ